MKKLLLLIILLTSITTTTPALARMWPTWSLGAQVTQPVPTPLTPTGTIATTTPTFTWKGVPEATYYSIAVLKGATTVIVFTKTSLTGTSWPAPPAYALSAGSYTWKIKTVHVTGNSTVTYPWSDPMPFTTAGLPPPPPPPTPPTLLAPGNNEKVTPLPTFTWAAAPEAESYVLLIKDKKTGIVNTYDLTGTSWASTEALVVGHTYSWQMASKVGTTVGPWSSPMTFTVVPSPPMLLTPDNNSTISTRQPTFTWEAVPEATSYVLVIKDAKTTKTYSLTGTSWVPTVAQSLILEHTYSWQMASKVGSTVGPWSSPMTFTVGLPPPTLTFPENNTTIGTPSPTFTWEAVTGATSYVLLIRNVDTGVENTYAMKKGTSGTPPMSNTMEDFGYMYEWRMASKVGSTVGPWSAPMTYIAALSPPSGQFSISQGLLHDQIIASITWWDVIGATSYVLLFKKDTERAWVEYNVPGDGGSFRWKPPNQPFVLGSGYDLKMASKVGGPRPGPWAYQHFVIYLPAGLPHCDPSIPDVVQWGCTWGKSS